MAEKFHSIYTGEQVDAAVAASQTAVQGAGTGLVKDGNLALNHKNSIAPGTWSQSGGNISYGASFRVPSFTYDETGHITTVGDITYTLPAAYTLPVATASALGGIKVGYTLSGKNYPVQLDADGKAYVNIPWTDTTYTAGTGISISGTTVSLATLSGATVGSYGPSVGKTLGYSDTFTVPYVTLDTYGRAKASTKTFTLPAAPAGSNRYTKNLAANSSSWTVAASGSPGTYFTTIAASVHGCGEYPTVILLDSNKDLVQTTIRYGSTGDITIYSNVMVALTVICKT